MKRLLTAITIGLTPLAASAQVSTLLCTYKSTHVPITINYNNSTVINMNGDVNQATITNTYIEFIDGASTKVSINRFTGQMVLNNHNDKPLQCSQTPYKF
jgi:hypothetical protein